MLTFVNILIGTSFRLTKRQKRNGMLRIVDLRDYKKPTTLDDTLRDALLKALQKKKSINRSKAMPFLLYLEVFLDCYDRKISFVDLNINLNQNFCLY